MNTDVEATLEDLEARLRALQAELGRIPGGVAVSPPAPEQPRAAPPPPRAAAPPDDPLTRFGEELRLLTAELVAAWDRVEAQARGPVASTGGPRRLVLETATDLHGLAALERALSQAPGVTSVELGAYAAGQASLIVDLQ